MHVCQATTAVSCFLMLSGCFGLNTPDIQEPYEDSALQRFKENAIVNQVKCELHQGILDTIEAFKKEGPGYGYNSDWILNWAAKINLRISAQEKGTISPNAGYTSPAGIFSLAGGLSASADATRAEIIGFTWSVREILSRQFPRPCVRIGESKIEGDLKIADFLLRKALIARVPGNIEYEKLKSPFDVFSYQVTFVTTYGGNGTPSWKFTRVSVNPGSPFFDTSRTRTDDLTITMGPAQKDEFGGYRLSQDAEDVQRASLFGQSIRNQGFVNIPFSPFQLFR